MNSLEPWEKYPDIWKSKTSFFTYLRGHLRQLWSRYPAKLKWKASQLSNPSVDYTGRAKKLGVCHYCKQSFAASHLEVDHLKQAGQCNSWDTAQQFLHNLLDCNDNWALACKPCHKIKSHAEKSGSSFEDARIAKQVILYCKLPIKEQLDKLVALGYNDVSNAAKRKIAWTDYLTKENNEITRYK